MSATGKAQEQRHPVVGSKGIQNVSQMLNKINSTMAAMGIQQQVQLQRQGEDRSVYHNVKDEEIKQLDYNAKLKRIAGEVLSHLDFDGKKEWALAKKREGNAAYRSEDLDGAIEKYMVGLWVEEKERRNGCVHACHRSFPLIGEDGCGSVAGGALLTLPFVALPCPPLLVCPALFYLPCTPHSHTTPPTPPPPPPPPPPLLPHQQ